MDMDQTRSRVRSVARMNAAGILAAVALIALFIMLWMDTRLEQKDTHTFSEKMDALARTVYRCQTRRIK